MLIEGPAGVGKTCLLQALESRASSHPVGVLRARGGELEQPFPFGIAAQLLRRAVASLTAAQRAAVLSGAAGLALEVIEPRVGGEAAGSPETRFARLHPLYWLCVELAAEHLLLLLVVDDAHWADELSSQWLLFMARRVGEIPLTLVLAARPEEWPAPLTLLAEEAQVARLRPRTLSENAAGILIERALDRAPDAKFTAACHRATGGNPFLLSELMAATAV